MKKGITILLFALTLISCEENNDFEKTIESGYNLDLTGETNLIGRECLVVDENNPSNKYSRIDSIKVYGLGIELYLLDSLKNTDIKLIFTGKMRETESITSNIAVSLTDVQDSMVFWGLIEAKNHILQPNTWITFKDSVTISSAANNGRAKMIKLFSSKGLGKGFFDVDDLKVELKKN